MQKQALGVAERELLAIHTAKAYEFYQAGNLKEAAERVQRIEAINPGDVNAVFLSGAIVGRRALPGKEMLNIRKAFQIWHPLFQQLTGEGRELMLEAMSEAFSTMSYTPVEVATREWDVYLNDEAAAALAGTMQTLMDYDDSASSATDRSYGVWIHSLYQKNYVFWANQVLGMNKPIPVGEHAAVRAYEQVIEAVCRMAERMEGTSTSDERVKARAFQTRETYHKLNRCETSTIG